MKNGNEEEKKKVNYMKQVAKLLGVELDKDFYIRGYSFTYKLSSRGLHCFCDGRWIKAEGYLIDLLLGRIVITDDIHNVKNATEVNE